MANGHNYVSFGPRQYSGYLCTICGSWVSETAHVCPGYQTVQPHLPQQSQQWPTSKDRLILSELQAIRELLEKLVAK